MTNSIEEIEHHDVIFVIGSNTTETHPIIALRMKRAVRKGATLIVADPRKIDLVRFARLWLPLRPGTDSALLNAMMHVIIREGLIDRTFIDARTEGFEALRESLLDCSPEWAADVTGVPAGDIVRAARLYGNASHPGIYYTMGITQHSHGTENVFAIANLALMTGNLGKKSVGVNPLRGQNNVQGATDMGCIPDFLPGYQKVAVPEIRRKFEKAWGVTLSDRPGLTATDMVKAALSGTIRALYIMGENSVLSDPDRDRTIRALQGLDLLVVQDIFLTETAALADVVFPAACFAEKDGTFTNTERRVQRVRKAVEPPGEARDDARIIAELSGRFGFDLTYDSIEDVFREAGRLWPALAGITYRRIAKTGLQWPCPTRDHPGTRYLFKGSFPRGRAAFQTVRFRPPLELPDEDYPLLLSTGRHLFHYHTASMTGRVESLVRIEPKPYVEISAADAEALGILHGENVRVSSRRGAIELEARISARPIKGVVFIPFHYRDAAANALTHSALDPLSRIPELKVCAVKIERVAQSTATTRQKED